MLQLDSLKIIIRLIKRKRYLGWRLLNICLGEVHA